MAEPTFASIDFGLTNTDASGFRSFVRVLVGPREVWRTEFGYPGLDGVGVQQLGRGGKQITWMLQVVSKTESAINTLEAAMDAKVGTQPYPMTFRGQTRANVELMNWAETRESIPLVSPWLQARVYELQFKDLTPGAVS